MIVREPGFSVRGRVAGYGELEIRWLDGVFDDPSGATDALIAEKATLTVTATGPFLTAAASPAAVALLTAYCALDEVREVVAGAALDALRELARLPDGAVA